MLSCLGIQPELTSWLLAAGQGRWEAVDLELEPSIGIGQELAEE